MQNTDSGSAIDTIGIRVRWATSSSDDFLCNVTFLMARSSNIVIIFSQINPTIQEADLESEDPSLRKCLYPHETHVARADPCFAEVKRSTFGRFRKGERFVEKWACEGKEMHFLRQYSQVGCFFECQLQAAVRKGLQGIGEPFCLPWNFPSGRYNNATCEL